jgi:hypothetical protein
VLISKISNAAPVQARPEVFDSLASNLVAGDAGGFSDVFVHDRETGETSLVSVSSAGAQANFHSHSGTNGAPSISYDGRYVAFVTRASNLVPSDTNNAEDIFVRDRLTHTTFRATLKSDGSEGLSCLLNGQTGGSFVLSYSGDEMLLSTALQLVHFDSPPGCWDSFHAYIRRFAPLTSGGFTDALLAGSTPIKALHITELRARIDAIRTNHGLPIYSWTDPTLTSGSMSVRAVHIIELRAALSQAYEAAGMASPIFTEQVLTPRITTPKAGHILELRAAVIDIEQ